MAEGTNGGKQPQCVRENQFHIKNSSKILCQPFFFDVAVCVSKSYWHKVCGCCMCVCVAACEVNDYANWPINRLQIVGMAANGR